MDWCSTSISTPLLSAFLPAGSEKLKIAFLRLPCSEDLPSVWFLPIWRTHAVCLVDVRRRPRFQLHRSEKLRFSALVFLIPTVSWWQLSSIMTESCLCCLPDHGGKSQVLTKQLRSLHWKGRGPLRNSGLWFGSWSCSQHRVYLFNFPDASVSPSIPYNESLSAKIDWPRSWPL